MRQRRDECGNGGEEPAWQVLGWPLQSRQGETLTVAELDSFPVLVSGSGITGARFPKRMWSRSSVCVCYLTVIVMTSYL